MITSVPVESQDPTEFAPGDLDDLLSSVPADSPSSSGSSSSELAAGGIFSPSSSNNSGGGDGGPSTMLFAGIAFILLALCGIGFSVYQQFFKEKLAQRKASAKPPHSRRTAQSRGAADILGVEDAYDDDNVYQDGYDYYDDDGDYEDYGAQGEEYTDISTAATNQPAQPSGTDRTEYTDISSSGPEPPDSAPQEKDIYSKEPSAQPKKGEDFDWDHFFRNNGDMK